MKNKLLIATAFNYICSEYMDYLEFIYRYRETIFYNIIIDHKYRIYVSTDINQIAFISKERLIWEIK